MRAERVWASIAIAGLAVIGCGKRPPPTGQGDFAGSETGSDDLPFPRRPSDLDVENRARVPSGTLRAQTKLEVLVDGKPVPMLSAHAWKTPDGRFKVTASSVSVGCDQATPELRAMFDGEVTFEIVAANLLQPDGKRAPAVVSTFFEGSTHGQVVKTTGTGDGTVDQPTTLDVSFEARSALRQGKTLSVKGTIEAVGCTPPVPMPVEAPPGAPSQGAQDDVPDAFVTVAGVKRPIRHALLTQHGDTTDLLLTSGGKTCAHAIGEQDGELELTLSWANKTDPRPSQLTLGGALLPSSLDQTFDRGAVGVDGAPPSKPGRLAIHGNVKANGYRVELTGVVAAELCRN